MSCGCKTSKNSAESCSTKSTKGCAQVDTCGNSYKLSVFDWLANVQNPTTQKCEWVEVRFKNDRKQFYHNTHNLPLHIGSVVVVDASPGYDVGVVSLTGELVRIQMKKKKTSAKNVDKVHRIATEKDIETWTHFRKRENAIKLEARKIAQGLQLQMKISDVEYQGDGSKVTFFYTAESRVDFRQLIKDLALAFRTKIDMKQIGFRQEASKIGGIGSCGRELCCSTWLTDFRSVNTNAARYQQLSINPQKLAGQCGKLKCCLNYELDSYLDSLKNFPPSSTTLETVNGKAFCIKIDVFKQKMWFAYVERSLSWYDIHIDDVRKMLSINEQGEKCPPLEDYKAGGETTVVSTDLIQEDSLDRFDRKTRKKSKPNTKTNGQKTTQTGKGEKREKREPRKANVVGNEVNTTQHNPPKNRNHQSKKRFKPKNKRNEGQ